MRRIAAQMDAVRKQTAALDTLGDSARRSDKRPQFLAGDHRRPECAAAKGEHLDHRAGRDTPAENQCGAFRAGRVDHPRRHRPRSGGPAASRCYAGWPAIDGILVRGLYLFNPKQQEVVVDYFRNLVGSPYFAIDPNNQAKVIKPTTPNNTEWAFPYELRLDLKKPMKLP